MKHTIEVGRDTYEKLVLVARLTGSTPGAVVEKMVADASAEREPAAPVAESSGGDRLVGVYVTYDGYRITGSYDVATKRIDITSGRLGGRSYKTPSAAARAVVEDLNPRVNSNRNGWTFWLLEDGRGPLQAIRGD
ncbi:hypothetical protein [Nocardia macrotermitis]|uniref:RAMA domain-containing protein n=1 Tax=Nocardia macrotermitis TaxID=2585198 RepID=A0A7K0DBJ2_9NOCA|nr:hypothetical protein [Nocardia macrotermitis]MQY23156.1 hypothetical protein [Nocardia macrotermitis]